jgi:putative ABC transport system permease protein
MHVRDILGFALLAVTSHRLRSALTAIGIAIGIAAVVLLTSLGQGVRGYVLAEFSQFGANLIAITPGKNTTLGMSGSVVNTVRPLTIDDAIALRRLPQVRAVAPVVSGNAEVEAGRRSRRTWVHGVNHEMPRVWAFDLAIGDFLPADDPDAPRALAVLGSKLRDELFGERNPLGELVRVGSDRYRVIGVLKSKGQFLGFDLDDAIYVPTQRALGLFDREGLMEVDVEVDEQVSIDEAQRAIERLLVARHGDEDFTVIPQQQMIDVLGSVLSVLTFAVAALGGISLVVGGVGILTIMAIAIRERTGEIGLLRALGATKMRVLSLFLVESGTLAAAGGLLGLLLGLGAAFVVGAIFPALPVRPSVEQAALAEAVAISIGLLAGTVPAIRASRLDPVDALRAE